MCRFTRPTVAIALLLVAILLGLCSSTELGMSTKRRVMLRYKIPWHERFTAPRARRLSERRHLLDDAHAALDPVCTPSLHDLHHVETQMWEFDATCDLNVFLQHVKRVDHAVEFEHDGIVYASAQQPDDPLYPQQWAMQELRLPYAGPLGSASNDSSTQYATRAKGSPSDVILITIIDSGVDTRHPDLQGRLWRNPREIPGNGIDDDGNGLIDDVHGYNFLADSGDVTDDYFHGTHLAGIVGAICDNDIGVCGINNEMIAIQACKFLDSVGTGLISNAVKCIDYALKSGAVLTLNSYGGYNQDSPTLRNAIGAAERAGQLFVTAAGNNDLQDLDVQPSYPASSNHSNVVTVASLDEFNQLAYYSNYGKGTVELAAPGSNIMSTIPTGNYGTHDGTSQAAGVTAGVIALILATYKQAGFDVVGRAKEVRNMIMDVGIRPIPSLRGYVQTGGMLDVISALQAVPSSVDQVPDYNASSSTLPYFKPTAKVSGQTVTTIPTSHQGIGVYISDVSSLTNYTVTFAYTGQQKYALCVRDELPQQVLSLADAYAEDVTWELKKQGAVTGDINTEDVTGELKRQGAVLRRTLPVGIQLGDMSLSDIALTSTGLLLVLPPNSTHTRNTTTGTPAYTPQASVSAATVDTMSAVGYEMYAELVGQAAAVDGRLTVDGTAFGGVAFALLPAAYDLSLGGEVAYIALSDRLVFTFTNVRPSATTPPTSFVTELFYLSSTLPVGSVRITVLEAGDGGDMVMGAFMGNENLLDADDVDRLRQCGEPASLVLKPVDSINTISQQPILQMPIPDVSSVQLVAAPAQRVSTTNPLYAQMLGLSGNNVLALLATNPGAQLLDAHLSVEPRGFNMLQQSLLYTISANTNTLRITPVTVLDNTTRASCPNNDTCIQLGGPQGGIVLKSTALRPRMLRVAPPVQSQRVQFRATVLRRARCDNHTFAVSPLAAAQRPEASNTSIIFGFECGSKFLQLPDGRRLQSREDCGGYGYNALYFDMQPGGAISLWDDGCDTLSTTMDSPFGGTDGAPQAYLYIGGNDGASLPRLELLTGFAPFNATVFSSGGNGSGGNGTRGSTRTVLVNSATQAGFLGWQLARPPQYMLPGTMAAASVPSVTPEATASSVETATAAGETTTDATVDAALEQERVFAWDTDTTNPTDPTPSLEASAGGRVRTNGTAPPATLWAQRVRVLPQRASAQLLQQLTTLRLTDRKAATLLLQWSARGGGAACDAELVVRSSYYDQPLWRIPLTCR